MNLKILIIFKIVIIMLEFIISIAIIGVGHIIPLFLLKLKPSLFGKILIFILGSFLIFAASILTMFIFKGKMEQREIAAIGGGHIIGLFSLVFIDSKKTE